jgi:hypothetical protein
MAFELVGKHRAKLTEVNIQSVKLGQTELKPAISLRWKVTLANDKLKMLDPTLLPFLYQKSSAAKAQGTLDGVPVVSDMPQLTEAARRAGSLGWKDEQTGCKLNVYQGVTGDRNIQLTDGTRTIQKIDPKEGGTVDVTFDYDAADLDAETMGDLAVLKNHELDIELTVPEILQPRQGRWTAPRARMTAKKPSNSRRRRRWARRCSSSTRARKSPSSRRRPRRCRSPRRSRATAQSSRAGRDRRPRAAAATCRDSTNRRARRSRQALRACPGVVRLRVAQLRISEHAAP